MGIKCCLSCFSSKDENTLDVGVLSEVLNNPSDIEELISFIQQRLEAHTADTKRSQQDPSSSQQNAGTSQQPRMESCVTFGRDLLENVAKRVRKHASKRSFGDHKTRKLIFDILKESVKVHWLGVGLSVIGYALEQIDQFSANKEQCVNLLRKMLDLAKHVRELKEELPENRGKLNDVVSFIVQGCLLCFTQMTDHSLFRFIFASGDAEDIQNFEDELGQKCQDLTMEAGIGVLKRTPHKDPPTQGQYPPNAVGIEKARDTVTGLLQLEVNDQTRRAVVIHGLGGMGKTTLATAVFNQLPLNDNNYKFCRLVIDEICSDERIKLLQQQLLLDLFGKNITLRDHIEGQEKLTGAFQGAPTQRVFMFIDNALKESDLAKLLPKDENLSCLPEQTRILLTTRNPDECRRFFYPFIQCHNHPVEVLNQAHSKQMLCKKALGSVDATFHQDVDIDGLVKSCGGIPLVLDLVGSKLRMHVSDVSDCKKMITYLKESVEQGEQKEISERVVDAVYEKLDQDCKEAFLDIACFFHSWDRSFVSYILGDPTLQALENAALVKISHDSSTRARRTSFRVNENSLEWIKFVRERNVREGFLEVHDIVKARGRELSKSDRIMDLESLTEAVQDPQNLKKIKGICIRERMSTIEIDAAHLDLMHASLRTLYIEGEAKINGKCRKDFKNLRCIYLPSNTSVCMDLAKLKRLKVLCADFSYNPSELPSSLHCLELRPVPDFQLSLNESFGKLSSLQELELRNAVILPQNFEQLKSLRLLRLSKCKMVTLPKSFGSLSALEGL